MVRCYVDQPKKKCNRASQRFDGSNDSCLILDFLYGIDADVIDGYGSIDQSRGFDEKYLPPGFCKSM